MTDLEIIQRAKMYMDNLAQGIDPVSGSAVPDDSALNQARLARCFAYVSGVLQQVIDNGGFIGNKPIRRSFTVTPSLLSRLAPAERALRVSDFADMIYAAAGDPGMKRPGPTVISNWLLGSGYLEKVTDANGKQRRVPTRAGRDIGIFTETVVSQYGEYTAVYYEPRAQQFLLNHLEEIFRPV